MWHEPLKKKVFGFDEWHFDRYARKIKVPLQYRYIKSGHTMNPTCPRVSPYICLDTKNRVLLGDHALEEKLIDMEKSNCPVSKEYKMYLQELQLLYCHLFRQPLKSWQQFTRNLSEEFSGIRRK